eukprot:1224976-Rhodomonas_salina.2
MQLEALGSKWHTLSTKSADRNVGSCCSAEKGGREGGREGRMQTVGCARRTAMRMRDAQTHTPTGAEVH